MMERGRATASEKAVVHGAGQHLASLLLSSTILGCAILAVPSVAYAQQASGAAATSQPANFAIPSQSLSSAINAFSRTTGWQVGFPASLNRSTTTRPVTGTMSPQQALQTMLAGTGIKVRITGARSAALVDPTVAAVDTVNDGSLLLETINVQGQGESAWGQVHGIVAKRSATGTKTDTPLIEVPQSISVVTRDQMDDQGATTVSESLRYTAGVLPGTSGTQERRSDSVFLRGFGGFAAAATYVSYLDGLKTPYPGRTSPQYDPWLLERVEVLKGPSSVIYGQTTPGGLVNLVSKHPSETAQNEVFTRIGTDGYAEAGFDFSGSVANDPRFLYRIVGLGRKADSTIDFQEEQRTLIAPSFTYAPSDDTKLTVTALYQKDPKTIDSAYLPVIGTIFPSEYGFLSGNTFQGDPQWNLYSRTQKSIGYQFEQRFGDIFTFRSNMRYGNLKSDTRQVTYSSLAADNRTLSRALQHHVHDVDSFSFDNNIQADFSTGELNHTAIVGVDYQYMDSVWLSSGRGSGSIGTIDLYNPTYYQDFVAPTLTNRRHDKLNQVGIYAQDQIAYENWRLTIGGRQDFANTKYNLVNMTTGVVSESSSNRDQAFTGRAGLVYLFDNGLAPYVSYSTSFEPEEGADENGNAFKPTTGRQIEAGIKYQPTGWAGYFSASAFNIFKNNVVTTDSMDPDLSVQHGEVRSRGIELEAKASLTDNIDIIAAYTYTDAKITKTNDTTTLLDGTVISSQGATPIAVPKHMASLWMNYTFTDGVLGGLRLGTGVRYVGSTYGTSSNVWNITGHIGEPSKVPDFTLVDAAISYDFGYSDPKLKGLSLDINAHNLFNKTYVASCTAYGYCSYGEGRSVQATLKYKW